MISQVKSEESFAAALRRMRLDKGWTQQQLADALGHSRRSVVNLEAGNYAPSARAWNWLKDLLGDELPVP